MEVDAAGVQVTGYPVAEGLRRDCVFCVNSKSTAPWQNWKTSSSLRFGGTTVADNLERARPTAN